MMNKLPRYTEKPWGFELLHVQTDRLVVKTLKIKAGKRTSLQYHQYKAEVMSVTMGAVEIELANEYGVMNTHLRVEGEYIYIAPGRVHRTKAMAMGAYITEVSTPELDDVIRLEDDYGRVN